MSEGRRTKSESRWLGILPGSGNPWISEKLSIKPSARNVSSGGRVFGGRRFTLPWTRDNNPRESKCLWSASNRLWLIAWRNKKVFKHILSLWKWKVVYRWGERCSLTDWSGWVRNAWSWEGRTRSSSAKSLHNTLEQVEFWGPSLQPQFLEKKVSTLSASSRSELLSSNSLSGGESSEVTVVVGAGSASAIFELSSTQPD